MTITQLVVNKKLINKFISISADGYETTLSTEPSEAERRSWLAKRLSKANIKESTVDLLDLEAHKRAIHQRTMAMEKRQNIELEL